MPNIKSIEKIACVQHSELLMTSTFRDYRCNCICTRRIRCCASICNPLAAFDTWFDTWTMGQVGFILHRVIKRRPDVTLPVFTLKPRALSPSLSSSVYILYVFFNSLGLYLFEHNFPRSFLASITTEVCSLRRVSFNFKRPARQKRYCIDFRVLHSKVFSANIRS